METQFIVTDPAVLAAECGVRMFPGGVYLGSDFGKRPCSANSADGRSGGISKSPAAGLRTLPDNGCAACRRRSPVHAEGRAMLGRRLGRPRRHRGTGRSAPHRQRISGVVAAPWAGPARNIGATGSVALCSKTIELC